MSDYISKTLLLHDIAVVASMIGEPIMIGDPIKIYDQMSAIVKESPAADVVERKKGKWKTAYLDHEAFGIRPQVWYCSECQQITSFRTFFCPNCGADTRGESDV